jgi:hypothetical protein
MVKTGIDMILSYLLVICTVGLLLYGIAMIIPGFFKTILKRFLNGAIIVFGILTPMAFFTIWAAAHDIGADYVSARLYAAQGRNLPPGYDAVVNSCQGEWMAFAIAFLVLIVFYALLFIRFLLSVAPTRPQKA